MQFVGEKSRPLLPGTGYFRRDSNPVSPVSSIGSLELVDLEIPEISFSDFENQDFQKYDLCSYEAELSKRIAREQRLSQRRSPQTVTSSSESSQGAWKPCGTETQNGTRIDTSSVRRLTTPKPDENTPNEQTDDAPVEIMPSSRHLFHFTNIDSPASEESFLPHMMSRKEMEPSSVLRSHVFMPRMPAEENSTLSPTPSENSHASEHSHTSEFDAFWSFDSPDFDHEPKSPSLDSVETPIESSEINMRKNSIPSRMKDEKYWRRRLRNNRSAKKSRDAKRAKEIQIANRIMALERENFHLKIVVQKLLAERNNTNNAQPQLRHLPYGTGF